MKKQILLTCFLLIPFWSGAQKFNESDLARLQLIPGNVETYYSKGCETKAEYLQKLVQDAVIFFQNKLADTFDVKLLVLNKSDWKLLVGGPYILTDFAKDPDRIEMGINELYKIKLEDNELLYGKKEAYYWDFISVHELGHYIGHRNNLFVLPWMGEFFADYILIGFLSEKVPEWQFPYAVSSALFKYLPLKYKSLEDFDRNIKIDPVNYSLYEGKLVDLANKIFEKRGWSFMYEYIERYKVKPAIDKTQFFQKSISDFKEMEPEIFNDWLSGMSKTYHPYLVFFILFALIGIIRFFDNSYRIFTNLGLKTKRRFRFFGVPAFSILSKLKSFENLKIKRKLKLIIALRPIMYFFVILVILLLILHH
ncbi:MAG: hypothetical protein NTZ85_03245 [Bacteroidia bacterium]|nr:hypothetical protein [Bacteroidia bacterium]